MTAPTARFDTIPAPARAFTGDPAGLVSRISANAIDLVVVVVLLVGAYLGICGFLFLRRGADFSFPTVTYAEAYWAGFAMLIVYFAVSWATSGRTVGDRIMGLRVRRRGSDEELHGFRALVRALLCAMFPFLLLWVAIDRRRRSVQDILVSSVVVYHWGGTRSPVLSDDPVGVRVDVAATVADEPNDGHAESISGLDRE